MRKIAPLIALTLAGCATLADSPSHNYRFSGQDETTTITGTMKGSLTAQELRVRFNGQEVLFGELDQTFTGDITGQEWEGKRVSASCSSKRVSGTSYDVRCIVFHGNERTVTLTF